MNILYQMESALPTISGTIGGSGAPVGDRIQEELAWWSGRTEAAPEAYEQLQKYWSHVGFRDWTPGGTPWSASWISYQLRDQDFTGSAAHWQYVQSVIDGESPGWQAYSIPKNNGRIQLAVGDVLIKPRSGSETATHGDIVYKIENGKAYLAGGNISDTAKTTKTIALNNGLATIPNYQIILKKSTGGYRSWMTIAAWVGTLGLGALIWSRRK